jgi:ankyrin repeat protein
LLQTQPGKELIVNRSLPTRSLRENSDLDQLRRQAKELLQAYLGGDEHAVAEVNVHYRDPDPAKFALHTAQLVLARAYGFESWPKLKAHVDGVTVKRMVDAVRSGDPVEVRALLKVRPELARMSLDNLQVLHHAVLSRSAEMVRVLMQHGANAHEGVYPFREATTALTIARERGYTEIVAIIEEEERRRPEHKSLGGWTPLHVAARALNDQLVASLLAEGADAQTKGRHGLAPLDVAAFVSDDSRSDAFARVAKLLLAQGAALTAPAAVALGDESWLRGRHAEGALINPIEDSGGLLRIAVSHNRKEILSMLLDFGFDPDERKRFEVGDEDAVVFTWGMPLWRCASTGRYEMAEMLLRRGADPNAEIYASGTPVHQAYGRRDWKMVELLRQYGGLPGAAVAGLYRQTELAKSLLAGKPSAEELLGSGACGGDPEIVRVALDVVDWPRDDPRWFGVLEQPLRMWNHGQGHWANDELDRGTYLTCFRLILERCDPNVRGRTTDLGQFGLTVLHAVAGCRDHMRPDERVGFATALLDAGARTDLRDNLLKSTPLGWACRWGRIELVKLLIERGADPVEVDAEPWASPRAWAAKMGHDEVLTALKNF